jgi:hypothetical protein
MEIGADSGLAHDLARRILGEVDAGRCRRANERRPSGGVREATELRVGKETVGVRLRREKTYTEVGQAGAHHGDRQTGTADGLECHADGSK